MYIDEAMIPRVNVEEFKNQVRKHMLDIAPSLHREAEESLDLAVHAYTKAIQALVDTCNLSSQPMIAMNAYLMAIQMTKHTVDATLAASLDTGLTKQVPVNIEMNGGTE